MAEKVITACCDAMECTLVQVESSFLKGFSGLQLIGHTAEVCRNGLERARAALEHVGISLPQKKIVVSLVPADIKKDGSQFDLAFAVSLALLIEDKASKVNPQEWLLAAELSLDGYLRPVKNIVSYAIEAAANNIKGVVIAPENLEEVLTLADLTQLSLSRFQLLSFVHLSQVLNWFSEPALEIQASPLPLRLNSGQCVPPARLPPKAADFDDMVLTPELAKIATVVGAGLHSLLLVGTPGTGKSMFSARINSILPPLSKEAHLDILKMHSSLSEHIPADVLAGMPPFRSPHHQASAAAIMGVPETPGEISLAHGGILFLDELPEFRRDIIEALREPLETGHVRVSRARRKVSWKSRITLIAACNLCPCGWFGSQKRSCSCPTNKIIAYRRKLSGPILDRIDLHVNVIESQQSQADFFLTVSSLKQSYSQTQTLKEKVLAARKLASERNRRWQVELNRDLAPGHLLSASGLGEAAFASLIKKYVPSHASPRSVVRSLRVARTLADLDGRQALAEEDLAQAWQWQPEAAAKARGDFALGLG